MNKCFKCGVSGDRALLFDAVSEKGIVKICRKCSFEENIPIIKYLKEKTEKRPTVYERLSRLSGIEIKSEKETPPPTRMTSEDEGLGVYPKGARTSNKVPSGEGKNFSKNVLGSIGEKSFGMVDNFHWIIMRARRAKKLTQKQFAETIEESEEAINMAEKGVLPKNDFVLVNKIENYLGIRIKNESARVVSFDEEVNQVKEEFLQNVEEDKIKFDDTTTKTLTIADLQEMKKKKEEKIFSEPEGKVGAPSHRDDLRGQRPQAYPETFPEEMFTKGKKIDLDKENLSQEDIDKIIFGK
ncbi:hypothetical protein KAT80_00520 [Candidatus Pacearchaeota archaeon]|nr:hypothetical protein [Candidatus Pacearchaeota archaeon]